MYIIIKIVRSTIPRHSTGSSHFPLIVSGFFVAFTQLSYIYDKNGIRKPKIMTRIRQYQKRLLLLMEPKMRRLMEKIKKDGNDDYFYLPQTDRDLISINIAGTVLNETIKLLNGYTTEELPDILELSINNLTSLQEQFVELEMYVQAQMMRDTIEKLNDDLLDLAGKELQ